MIARVSWQPGISALLIALVAASSTGQAVVASDAVSASPRLRLDQGRLALIPLDVSVVDMLGRPAQTGELVCFGHELGLCYPDPGRGNLMRNGRLLVHLPADTYTVIAYGPGFCLTRDLNLRKPASLVLRPEAGIRIRTLDTKGQELDGTLITAAPSRHAPFLRLVSCGTTDKGEFTLHVSRGATLEIVAQRNPPVGLTDGTAYCYHAAQVKAGSRIVLGGDARKLAQLRWELLNARGEHCPRTSFDIEIPTLSMVQPIHFWCDENHRFSGLTLWMTPASLRASMVGWPQDRCAVEFYPKLMQCKPGQQHLLRAGGKLTPRLLFHPDLSPRQVCVSVADEFGGNMRSFNYQDPAKHAVVRLYRPDGTKVHEEILYGTADKDLTKDPRSLDCEAEMDLGFFGIVRVRGRIDDPQCRLKLQQKQTPHFRVEWPEEFDNLFPAFEHTAETCYRVISEVLGVELRKKGFYRQTLFGPGWCGGGTFSCHYFFLRDPRSFGYADDTFKGAFAHEMGHLFQGTSQGYSDYGGPSPIHKEVFASALRNLAKERLIGARAARCEDLANRQVFLPVLYDRAGLLAELGERPYDRGEVWRYYFLVSHLMDIYGSQPLRHFMRFWGDARYRQPWQAVFDARKLTPDEQVCVTYSLYCGTNLARLFAGAGIEVDATAVQAALAVKADTSQSQLSKP